MFQDKNIAQFPVDPKKIANTKVYGFAPPNRTTDSSNNQPTQELLPHKKHDFSELFYHWWHKIAVILLTIHGLVGIWESIKFMAIDFPELDRKLNLHEIQVDEVNNIIAFAVIVLITTLINIFMALRLSKTQESTAHNIDLFIATILIVGTKYIQETLIQFDLLNIFINSLQ